MNYTGAGLIVFSSDLTHILLVQDTRSGKWGFPKGHREIYDEDDFATAVRECREETGLVPGDYNIDCNTFKINKGAGSYIFRYAILIGDYRYTRLQAGPAYEVTNLEWIPLTTLFDPTNILDGNKYLRTWIMDLKTNTSKKTVHLFKKIAAAKGVSMLPTSIPSFVSSCLLPSQESAYSCDIIACT